MEKINMEGKRFGRLTVIEEEKQSGSSHRYCLCKCDCGTTKRIRADHLNSGKIISCGCHRKENGKLLVEKYCHKGTHHLSKTKIYRLYYDIKRRCNDKKGKSYKNYGGRGIKMCVEWEKDFMAFYKYIKPIYSDGKEIDRIDNNRGYEPGNVRFVTSSENKLNRRNTLMVSGIPLKTYCNKLKISYYAILSKIRRGASVQNAVNDYLKKHRVIERWEKDGNE